MWIPFLSRRASVGESRAQPVSFDRDFSVPDRAAPKGNEFGFDK
jgi:hypothetical protein